MHGRGSQQREASPHSGPYMVNVFVLSKGHLVAGMHEMLNSCDLCYWNVLFVVSKSGLCNDHS